MKSQSLVTSTITRDQRFPGNLALMIHQGRGCSPVYGVFSLSKEGCITLLAVLPTKQLPYQFKTNCKLASYIHVTDQQC